MSGTTGHGGGGDHGGGHGEHGPKERVHPALKLIFWGGAAISAFTGAGEHAAAAKIDLDGGAETAEDYTRARGFDNISYDGRQVVIAGRGPCGVTDSRMYEFDATFQNGEYAEVNVCMSALENNDPTLFANGVKDAVGNS